MKRFCLIWVMIFGLLVPAVFGENSRELLARAEEWQRAAENRETAAITQQAQAEEMILVAQELRKKEYGSEKERKKNWKMAGDKEREAGDCQGKAFANFDLAAGNWLNVANELEKVKTNKDLRGIEHKGFEDKGKNARLMNKLAKDNGTAALRKAADAFELAAEAYGASNVNDAGMEAMARERAATFREMLARRN